MEKLWTGIYVQNSGLAWLALSRYCGHPMFYVRDLAGRMLYQTNANNEVQQITCNPADELLTLTDGKGQTPLGVTICL